MRISEKVFCNDFPCSDIVKGAYVVPNINANTLKVKTVMISEAAPSNSSDYYYADGAPLFGRTTVQAFQDAGLEIEKMNDILDRGFYLTTAVKCGKTGYAIDTETVRQCSILLEKELDLFPNLSVIMLMGDVAIKMFNEVAKRKIGKRVVPAGSTYKIRKTPYYYGSIRVFPSYLQAGPSFFIEKSKRKMIAEDIREALNIIGQ